MNWKRMLSAAVLGVVLTSMALPSTGCVVRVRHKRTRVHRRRPHRRPHRRRRRRAEVPRVTHVRVES